LNGIDAGENRKWLKSSGWRRLYKEKKFMIPEKAIEAFFRKEELLFGS
jgi:hypothetical protein